MVNQAKIICPIDGDFVNIQDGYKKGEVLFINVMVDSYLNNLKINGIPVVNTENGTFAEVPIEQYENNLQLTDESSNILHEIKIYRMKKHDHKYYRLSVDDNIWFLKDIAKNKYKSIFDNEYLSFYKDLHDKYGLKLQLNLYYETDGFNLQQMPDTYKSEWKESSSWLKMTFHALADSPGNPYINSSYDEVKKHCEMVDREICRFAGKELLDCATTIHFGSANREGCIALKEKGYNALAGYFILKDGVPLVSYYLNREQTEHLNKRDFWMDASTGIVFFKNDIVLNTVKLNEIEPILESLQLKPHESGFLEMMIHEQYFYPYYVNYQPDFRDKVETAVKWVTEKGYKPVFISDLLDNKLI